MEAHYGALISLGIFLSIGVLHPRVVSLTVSSLCAATHFAKLAPGITDPVVTWFKALNKSEIVALMCMIILFAFTPRAVFSSFLIITANGLIPDLPGKAIAFAIRCDVTNGGARFYAVSAAGALVALGVGAAATLAAPIIGFSIFTSVLCTMHLTAALKQVVATPVGPRYSDDTLNAAQREEKERIEQTRKQLRDKMQTQTPVVVPDAPTSLPPNQPTTVTVEPPPSANVPLGQLLPAFIEDEIVPVQPMPVDAKALSHNAHGKLQIEVKIGVPNRGDQLDDEALFDTKQYGARRVVVDVGGKLVEMRADFVPPAEVRPHSKYVTTDAVRGGPLTHEAATMTLSWDPNEQRTVHAAADGTLKLDASLLPTGTAVVSYTIEISGFVSKSARFVSHNQLIVAAQLDLPMSRPVLLPSRQASIGTVERLRVVLKWGARPSDLDLHCVTSRPVPINSRGDKDDHMFYQKKGKDGEMRLDKDDTSGHGHETLTLDRLQPNVSYWFGTHHFSGDGNLATSEATLEVYGLTSGILANAGFAGVDASPFRLVVPRIPVAGCDQKGVWQGFGLAPNGHGGFVLTVANKLVAISANDTSKQVYKIGMVTEDSSREEPSERAEPEPEEEEEDMGFDLFD